MTRTPLSRSKGQRSRSPGRFTHRGVYTQAAVSVGTYCARESAATLPSAGAAVGSAARGAWAPTGEERGEHMVSPRAQLVEVRMIKQTVKRSMSRRLLNGFSPGLVTFNFQFWYLVRQFFSVFLVSTSMNLWSRHQRWYFTGGQDSRWQHYAVPACRQRGIICTGCIARLVLYRRWSLTYCHSLPGHNAFPTLADPPGSSTCFSAPCGGRRPFGSSSTQTSIHAGRRALDNYLPAHSVTQAARSTQPRKNISIWFWPTSRTDDARCTENHVYLTHQSLLSTSDNNDAKKEHAYN